MASNVCTNTLTVPMNLADLAILNAVEKDVLDREVIEAALDLALAELLEEQAPVYPPASERSMKRNATASSPLTSSPGRWPPSIKNQSGDGARVSGLPCSRDLAGGNSFAHDGWSWTSPRVPGD
jgi:hypothetical protein